MAARRSPHCCCCCRCYRSVVELHELSPCGQQNEYEYSILERCILTPSGRGRTVAAGILQSAGGPLAQSNAARLRHAPTTPLEPLCCQRGLRVVYRQGAQVVRARHGRCAVFEGQLYGRQKCTVHFVKFLPSPKYPFALFQEFTSNPTSSVSL